MQFKLPLIKKIASNEYRRGSFDNEDCVKIGADQEEVKEPETSNYKPEPLFDIKTAVKDDFDIKKEDLYQQLTFSYSPHISIQSGSSKLSHSSSNLSITSS